MISDGYTANQAAVKLKVSGRTVECWVEKLKAVYGSKNVTHLVATCLRKGIIK